MKKRFLLLACCVVFGSNGFSQTISGEWGYNLNDSNEATITSYNGAGGAVTIPATLDGYPIKGFGGLFLMSVFGYNNASVTSVIIPGSVTSIGGYAFGGCTGLTSVTIPEGVRSIGMQAFQDCTSLTSTVIPNSVTIIESGVFLGCINLKTLTIGTGVQLENGGLMNILGWGNVNLTHVIFADGTARIADNALGGMTSLVSVTMPSSVTSIGSYAFGGCTGLTSAVIPAGVTSIGNSAFANCSSLPSVTIPSSVMSIGDYAFNGCTGLTSLTIPEGVTRIAQWTFAGCTSLVSVTIPNGVTSIGDYAFNGCTSLTTVTIPNSVLSIGPASFSGCSSLARISLPQGVTNIGYWAFEGTALTEITIPESVIWLGSEAFFRAPIASAVIPAKFIAQYGTIGLSPELSSSLLLSELAKSFATDDAVSAAEARGIASVTSDPASFGLFDSTQYEANRITGVAEGRAEVTGNPTAYSLFTESSIMDMNLGSLMLKKRADANALDLELTIETKDNLTTDGWQVAERITRLVSMEGVQRQFLRVRAGAPYVAPNVKILAHPTLGNILTDGAGRVLYFFAADTPGGNPLFSGSSWPYVTVPEAPKADAGVSAMLASSTFGKPGGPYLTINGRPAYYYVGDSEAGQANGHAVGSVWWTIKVDGVINQ
jgi:predicted lipoprotein with Yx(FWY)xxD motif